MALDKVSKVLHYNHIFLQNVKVIFNRTHKLWGGNDSSLNLGHVLPFHLNESDLRQTNTNLLAWKPSNNLICTAYLVTILLAQITIIFFVSGRKLTHVGAARKIINIFTKNIISIDLKIYKYLRKKDDRKRHKK